MARGSQTQRLEEYVRGDIARYHITSQSLENTRQIATPSMLTARNFLESALPQLRRLLRSREGPLRLSNSLS
jgi:hypothetical protein